MKFCECVSGGTCVERGYDTFHKVTVRWAAHGFEDTIATPVSIDEWLSTGQIEYAHCPTCDDAASDCPAFRKFLLSPAWELTEGGRNLIRELARQRREDATSLNSLISALAYLLGTYGARRVQARAIGPQNYELVAKLHELWLDDAVLLTDVHYWYRVLSRYAGLQPQQ